MTGLRNSQFGKRLRPSRPEDEEDEEEGEIHEPQRDKPRINPIFATTAAEIAERLAHSSTPALDSSGPTTSDSESPVDPRPQKDYGDRFIPSRDSGDIRTSYHLLEEETRAPKKIIPTESDALREQANTLFSSILQTEVTPSPPAAPSSPTRSATAASTPAPLPSTPTRKRLFSYQSPAGPSTPGTPRRLDASNDEAYSMSPVRAESRLLLESPRRQLRSVNKTPYRVLDAPDLQDDFYLNLVDWSSTNVLGVGLGACVYLWTAHTAAVAKLCDLQGTDKISSVSWVRKGSTLAIGTVHGRLHIYDAETLQLTRTYQHAHQQRVGTISWNDHVLSSGSRDRMIYHRDVREQSTRPFKRAAGHRQEVCGLRWSEGGVGNALLASGGNDNKVCIWDLRGSVRAASAARATASGGPSDGASGAGPSGRRGSSSSVASGSGAAAGSNAATAAATSTVPDASASGRGRSEINSTTAATGTTGEEPSQSSSGSGGDIPLHKFHEHTAAVKALAWDPHLPGLLATGGGTADKRLLFWNVGTGQLTSQLDTGSQICNLVWSLTSHEIVSTHGFSPTTVQNQICIWKYPTMDMVASLTGHTHRVLYLAMSPDGETIVTGAGDETLRFWSAFPKEKNEQRLNTRLDYSRLIR